MNLEQLFSSYKWNRNLLKHFTSYENWMIKGCFFFVRKYCLWLDQQLCWENYGQAFYWKNIGLLPYNNQFCHVLSPNKVRPRNFCNLYKYAKLKFLNFSVPRKVFQGFKSPLDLRFVYERKYIFCNLKNPDSLYKKSKQKTYDKLQDRMNSLK